MTDYWDDFSQTRRAVTPTHFDDWAGVRKTALEGRWDPFSGTPPPPPPDPTPSRYLGMYSTSISDDAMYTMFGRRPQLGATYWQLANAGSALTTERTRAQKGISSHSVIAPKDSANYPTGARDYINGLVAGTAQYVDFFSDWLNALQTASLAAPEGTPKMIMFPMCEPEVLRQQSALVSLQTNLGGSIQACMERVGEYHQVMYDLAADICPNVLRGVWLGGSSGQYTNINYMLGQIDSGVQRAGTDPYQNSLANGNSPWTSWASRVNAYRVSGQAHYVHWNRWGQPPVILTEVGISHYNPNSNTKVNTDAQKAAWISQIRADMAAHDIERVVYFNSAGPNGHQRIDQYTLSDPASSGNPESPFHGDVFNYGPLARAAFGAELAKEA